MEQIETMTISRHSSTPFWYLAWLSYVIIFNLPRLQAATFRLRVVYALRYNISVFKLHSLWLSDLGYTTSLYYHKDIHT